MKTNPKRESQPCERGGQEASLKPFEPRTLQGKQPSKYNAIRRGLFANLVLRGEPFRESEKDFRKLWSSLRAAISPADGFEEILVEKLAFLHLRLSRIYKADAELGPALFERIKKTLRDDYSAVVQEFIDKKSEVAVVRKDPEPDLLLRYESNAERQTEKILDQLERWRRLRRNGT